MLRCHSIREMPFRVAWGGVVLRARFCAAPAVTTANTPSAETPSSFEALLSSPNPPTRPSHIVYHLLKAKGPLTRKQIEEELSKHGLFDMTGHLARKRLVNNRNAVAQTNKISLPSKPTPVPRSKLTPLIPESKQQTSTLLSATGKRAPETSILPFVVPTPEFEQIAKVNTDLAFPSTARLNNVLSGLKRQGKVEAKPKPGQPLKGRKVFAFRIKEGSPALLTPAEFEASGGKAAMEARIARNAELRQERLMKKKEAWASYINGEEYHLSSLVDPRIIEAREEARKQKMLGFKA